MTQTTEMDDVLSADEQSPQRRADTYRLLSESFHEPSKELLERFESMASDETYVDTEALAAAATELRPLQLDHAKLFVGPFEVPAPPYGSTYLDDEQRVMTESTTEVQEWYRREGLDIGLEEPADHISAELEFVGVLVLAEQEMREMDNEEAAIKYIERQYDFLGQHLGRWISVFADNIREHAETEFYRILADETQSFVESDGKKLAKRIEAIEDDDTDGLTGGDSNDS